MSWPPTIKGVPIDPDFYKGFDGNIELLELAEMENARLASKDYWLGRLAQAQAAAEHLKKGTVRTATVTSFEGVRVDVHGDGS